MVILPLNRNTGAPHAQSVLFSGSVQKLLDEKPLPVSRSRAQGNLNNPDSSASGFQRKSAVTLLSDTWEEYEEHRALHYALGYLWMNGATVDWNAYFTGGNPYKTHCLSILSNVPGTG